MRKAEFGDHRSQAIRWSLEGNFKRALRHLKAAQMEKPNDDLLEMESLVLQAANGNPSTEEELRSKITHGEVDSKMMSRFYTGRAFINYFESRHEDGKADLAMSLDLDQDYALSHNSLARHYLFIEKDPGLARQHLEEALRLSPEALSPTMDLINLEAESHEFGNALARAKHLLSKHPMNARAWMAFLVSAFLAAPWSGRSAIIPIAILMFAPYVGPAFLGIWILFSAFAYSSLRRTHGAISTTPIVMLAIFFTSFVLRWLLLGSIWP